MEIKAYAKINLALEVMGLCDGYRMVNNLMVLTDLYDVITLEKDKSITLKDNKIEDNIMIKAANAFFNHFKIDSGVYMTLDKRIPVAAGLAGGSTDAASVLKGLNELYNVNASSKELEDIAKTLGSDVPFFIDGRIALCTNRGEVVNHLNCNVPLMRLTLIKIEEGLSTALVYKNYKYEGISKKDKIDNIIASLNEGNIDKLKDNIFNDLTKPALSLNENLSNLYKKLNLGARIYLSGSGPTMFGINLSEKELEYVKNNLPENTFIYEGYIGK